MMLLRRRLIVLAFVLAGLPAVAATAHPLGNFTVNHFARIEAGRDRVRIHYVVDMAEIPAFQQLQVIDLDRDGVRSASETDSYLMKSVSEYTGGLSVELDGKRQQLRIESPTISTPAGAGGMLNLRIECDLITERSIPFGATIRRLEILDGNHSDKLGWREMIVVPDGVSVFESTAYATSLSDELRSYPEDLLQAPLDERKVEFSVVSGSAPSGAAPLLTRGGTSSRPSPDRLSELIATPELTPRIALLGLLLAFGLGCLHAMSPGHGKTIVGAYLVGSRGTPKHAAFLGLTVTVTHTAGVFALGLITLLAAEYLLPETLFPFLSVFSGAIVLVMGLTLFGRRLRGLLAQRSQTLDPGPGHVLSDEHDHNDEHHGQPDESNHHHENDAGAITHSHGGRVHAHLPPGTDGSRVTWRSLLALGISGGILPCPSALVVLLSAISLHRTGYGLLLVLAFSAGLACVLTAVGLLFLYAAKLFERPLTQSRIARLLPIASSLVIASAGGAICYQAAAGAGWLNIVSAGWVGVGSMIGLGFLLGLRHAFDADHLAAVSVIATESKGMLRSSMVGAVWGIGHTVTLLVVCMGVILAEVRFDERIALSLEFGVALMLIALGVNTFRRLPGTARMTIQHAVDGRGHRHAHVKTGSRFQLRPLLIGMVHGLAGSAALVLLVAASTRSAALSFAYVVAFGLGSVSAMAVVSALLSIPICVAGKGLVKMGYAVRAGSAAFSLVLGLFLAYRIGIVDGLFR